MAVPTPTYEDLDLRDGWTEGGSPSYIDDQHNPEAALAADGVNDILTRAAVITTGQTKYSLSYWVRFNDTDTGYHVCQDQGAGFADKNFRNQWSGSNIWHVAYGTTDNTYSYKKTATELTLEVWYHFLATVDGTDPTLANKVELFLNGSSDEDTVVSGPSGGFNNTTGEQILSLGGRGSYSPGYTHCDISRIKLWNGTELSSAQATEEYNNEFAAIGEGFNVDVTGNIIGTVFSQIMPNNGIMGNIIT